MSTYKMSRGVPCVRLNETFWESPNSYMFFLIVVRKRSLNVIAHASIAKTSFSLIIAPSPETDNLPNPRKEKLCLTQSKCIKQNQVFNLA